MVPIVITPERYDGPICDLSDIECRCVEQLGATIGSITRQIDVAILNGESVAISYDPSFGDLVLISDVASTEPTSLFLDGFDTPNGSSAPSPNRSGSLQAGPNRGRYPQIEADSQGRLHVAYVLDIFFLLLIFGKYIEFQLSNCRYSDH